jgi:NhaP-type Na+/H+ or K+/H+ antiporter
LPIISYFSYTFSHLLPLPPFLPPSLPLHTHTQALSILLFKTAFDDYVQPQKEVVDHFTGLRALILLTTAILIGVLVALATSLLLRLLSPSFQTDPLRQVLLLILSNYLSYGIAESLELSGTLTLLFCTFTLSHYAFRNLAPAAKAGAGLAFELMAALAEAFSFVYIGLTLAGLSGKYSARFSLLVFLSLCVARVVVVLLLSFLLRLWGSRGGRRGGVALSMKEQVRPYPSFPPSLPLSLPSFLRSSSYSRSSPAYFLCSRWLWRLQG